MKNTCMAVLLAAVALPLAAQAQSNRNTRNEHRSDISYTYAELRYVDYDTDGGDGLDGFRLAGSYLFGPQLFGTAGLTSVSSGPVDVDQFDFGLGLRTALQSNVDFVAIGALIWQDVSVPGGSNDDTGISLTGGVRATVAPQFELGGYVGYVDVGGDGDIGLTGEALFHLNREISLLASLGLSDDVNTLTLGARWNFR